MADSVAKLTLKRMLAWASKPTLSDTEIDGLLTKFSKEDVDGLAPTAEDWTPTYDLRRAAAEGWRWKMAAASDLISSDLDGDRMSANQIFDHCERMVRKYAGTASPAMGTSITVGETNVAAESAFE
ncbi:MAG TPA: hypothetical protein VGO43_13625 [Pyrinomonadaceae bacterium]|jgi:hypothetical protein|nr:hypothetical protein [Pyrinomonadaceae bacterium]